MLAILFIMLFIIIVVKKSRRLYCVAFLYLKISHLGYSMWPFYIENRPHGLYHVDFLYKNIEKGVFFMTGMISVITQGLILSIMALGIYITYKILDFPDLSVDGSFALGGAIIAFSLTNNISPIVGTVLAIICGLISGLVTGIYISNLKFLTYFQVF